jgi:hypothetical protein
VLASTATLSSTLPPQVNGATSILCNPCYYAGSSDATGNYSLSVRSSTSPYYVYSWYGTNRAGPYTVNLSTPGVTLTQNVVWP